MADQYSLYVISAMCGNFWVESNINPGIWESLNVGNWTDLNVGYGLGQWTNTGGDTHGRLYKVHEWLVNNNYPIDDGDAQAAYIIVENYWIPKPEYSQFSNLSDFLNSQSNDIETLTHAWNWCWEGIHDATWDTRVANARRAMQYIQDHKDDTSITSWIVGNRFLSESEILNNCVMLYRAIGGGVGPTPPPPPGKKSKMPLWMMLRYHY